MVQQRTGLRSRRAKSFASGVGRRLALAFAMIVLVGGITSLASIVIIRSLDADLKEIIVERHSRTELVREVIDEINAISAASRDVILQDDDAERQTHLQRIAEGRKQIGTLMEQLDMQFKGRDGALPTEYKTVHTASSSYLIGLVRFTRSAQSGNMAEAKAILAGPLRSPLELYSRALYELKTYDANYMHGVQKQARHTSLTAQRFIWVLLAAAMVHCSKTE